MWRGNERPRGRGKRLFAETESSTPPNSPHFSKAGVPPSPTPKRTPAFREGKRPRTEDPDILNAQTKKLSVEDENFDGLNGCLMGAVVDQFVRPPPKLIQSVSFRRSGQPLYEGTTQIPRSSSLLSTKATSMDGVSFHHPPSPTRGPPRGSCPHRSPNRITLPRVSQNPWSPRPKAPSPPLPLHRRSGSRADLNTLQQTSLFGLLFEELGTLGKGSFGTVFKCLHIVDGWEYAVKISNNPVRGNRDLQFRLNEVFALAALPGHPNLVRYYNAWVFDGYLYIQMEFCDLGSLQQKENVCYSEAQLCEMIFQLSSGLDCLHSFGMVHKDVKPDNIYISTYGKEGKVRYKIGDFGLIQENAESDDGLDGDCRYLAPEALEGHPNPRSDIFSLGLSMYHLATQHEPPKRVAERRELTLPPSYSLEFLNLLKRMTDPDFKKRPTAKELMYHPIIVQYSGNEDLCGKLKLAKENEQLKEDILQLKQLLSEMQANKAQS